MDWCAAVSRRSLRSLLNQPVWGIVHSQTSRRGESFAPKPAGVGSRSLLNQPLTRRVPTSAGAGLLPPGWLRRTHSVRLETWWARLWTGAQRFRDAHFVRSSTSRCGESFTPKPAGVGNRSLLNQPVWESFAPQPAGAGNRSLPNQPVWGVVRSQSGRGVTAFTGQHQTLRAHTIPALDTHLSDAGNPPEL